MISKYSKSTSLKHYLLIISILPFLSPPSFAKGNWTCWGWQSNMEKDRNRHSKLEYSDDVCVRNDSRPLLVDVYLHKIKYSGKKSNSLDVDIAVEVTNKKTKKSYFLRGLDTNSSLIEEYVKRFEFPVGKGGEYNVEVKQIWMIYRKNGLSTGSFVTTKKRSGVTNIENIDTCP